VAGGGGARARARGRSGGAPCSRMVAGGGPVEHLFYRMNQHKQLFYFFFVNICFIFF